MVLAKVDAYDERNKELKDKYGVYSYPTIKIMKNGGSDVRGYGGPREADGIVEYLKRQVGPASLKLESEEAAHSVVDKGVILVSLPIVFAKKVCTLLLSLLTCSSEQWDYGRLMDVMHVSEICVVGGSFP